MLPATLDCPHCKTPISASAGVCGSCGLDATLLFAIHRGAGRLAALAANRAGAGDWQQAYDLSAHSLRLVRRGNDLAAFVLLGAAVAGARGTVARVPRPRGERLPAALAEQVEPLVERVRSLRSAAPDEAQPEPSPEKAALSTRPPAEAPAPPVGVRPSAVRPAWAAGIAATGLLLGGLAGAWWRDTASPLPDQGISSAHESSSPPAAAPLSAEPQATMVRTRLAELEAVSAVEQSALEGRWVDALRFLAALPEGTAERPSFDRVRREGGLAAWRRAYRLSAAGRYPEAEELLALVVAGPRDRYYWDDALYYLARAQHRQGRLEAARESYQRLLVEAPAEELAPHARRFLAQLGGGPREEAR